MNYIVKTILTTLILFTGLSVLGQEIELGPDEIAQNQSWTIIITVKNESLKSYSAFPDIKGFQKMGTSSQSQTSIVNGQMSSSQSIIMTYAPTKQGSFVLEPFSMKINDNTITSGGKTIKVVEPTQNNAQDPFQQMFDGGDPFRDFFGRKATEFVNVKEDAFLALTTSKNQVRVGEGFTATLSFFVSDNNKAPMQFHDLGTQLGKILKKIKPSNCWEENFNIENIEGKVVKINDQGYTQYIIYQANFYPLNSETVAFPSVSLEMIKFKVAKNPSFFGQNRQQDFKTFFSKPKTVIIKELPPHPLKNSVAVGNYRLEEDISFSNVKTGQSTSYNLTIVGEGNISYIQKPEIVNNNNFDFYEPNIHQSISRQNGQVTGSKAFSYFIVPKEPGDYNLGDYFEWIYFNTVKNRYDTLRSKIKLHVDGESKKNQTIQSNDLGSFYDRIDIVDNDLRPMSAKSWVNNTIYGFVALIFFSTLFLIFIKVKKS